MLGSNKISNHVCIVNNNLWAKLYPLFRLA